MRETSETSHLIVLGETNPQFGFIAAGDQNHVEKSIVRIRTRNQIQIWTDVSNIQCLEQKKIAGQILIIQTNIQFLCAMFV